MFSINKILRELNEAEKVTIEIYTDERPAVIVNGVNITEYINPVSLKKWFATTLHHNYKGRVK